jgi:predicted nucleic acid-binding protein
MRLVVDANVLFSAMIKNSTTRRIFFDENIELFAPDFLIDEFRKYERLILDKAQKTPDEFASLVEVLRNRINLVSEIKEFMPAALRISPDRNDATYFALALKLGIPIWSNDRRLKKQDQIKIINTDELLNSDQTLSAHS